MLHEKNHENIFLKCHHVVTEHICPPLPSDLSLSGLIVCGASVLRVPPCLFGTSPQLYHISLVKFARQGECGRLL